MIVQMSTLGTNGRFANQIFQYFFLKLIEKELKLEIRYPFWLGAHLFKIPPSPNGVPTDGNSIFQRYYEPDSTPRMELENLDSILKSIPYKAVDLIGFFQYNTKYLQRYRKLFLEIFEVQLSLINQIFAYLQTPKDMVAAHVRRGDFLFQENSPVFWCHSVGSIVSALSDFKLLNAEKKFLYLASDDVNIVSRELSEKNIYPITSYDLHPNLNQTQRTIVDFVCLTLAENLLISNSSFSFAAAMINQHSKLFLRPSPTLDKFLQFDPWNSPVLLNRNI
jgi:Glycosyl transferase family 11